MNVFEIEPENREQAYRDLRAQLESDYAGHVGPSMQRNRRHQISKMRGAAGHERQADTAEEMLERDVDDYDQGVHNKFVLAILTGRYDSAVLDPKNPRSPGSSTNQTWDAEIKQATEIRQNEMRNA